MQREDSIGKDATSKETLEDLEENEASVDESEDDDLHSPDGAFDESSEVEEGDLT